MRTGAMSRWLLASSLLFGSASATARAQWAGTQKAIAALRAIPPVYVSVEATIDDARVDTTRLKTFVELTLRQAGIRVAVPGDSAQGWVILHVAIVALQINDNAQTVYTRTVYLRDNAVLARPGGSVPTAAVIWLSGPGLFLVGARHSLQEQVEQDIRRTLDEFLNDYLAANPRRPPR